MKDLAHNIRNATTALHHWANVVEKELPHRKDICLSIMKEAKRIEQSLISYQIRIQRNS